MMTRKEKELKVLEAFGLKVGDKIKIIFDCLEDTIVSLVTVVENEERFYLKNKEEATFNIDILFREEWEKIKPSTKNKKCKDFDRCIGCPIYKSDYLDCGNGEQETLEEKYNKAKQDLDKLKTEIYGDENGNN